MNLPMIILITQIQQANVEKGFLFWIIVFASIVIVAYFGICAMRGHCHQNMMLPTEVSASKRSVSLLNIKTGSWIDVWHFNQMDVLMSHVDKRYRFQCTFGGDLKLYEDLKYYEFTGFPQRIQVIHKKDSEGNYVTSFVRVVEQPMMESFV